MITHTPPLAGYLLIKTLVARQRATNNIVSYWMGVGDHEAVSYHKLCQITQYHVNCSDDHYTRHTIIVTQTTKNVWKYSLCAGAFTWIEFRTIRGLLLEQCIKLHISG